MNSNKIMKSKLFNDFLIFELNSSLEFLLKKKKTKRFEVAAKLQFHFTSIIRRK